MIIKELANYLRENDQPKYRLGQALRSYYQELHDSWDQISTWPASLRESCKDMEWSPLAVHQVHKAESPSSAKLLLKTKDDNSIETVIMSHDDGRNTVCLSSQIGCAMGCTFCATGKMGFTRNLTTSEIVDQVIHAARYLKQKDSKVTNIVFMGMGEPFHNTDAVFEAINILTDPELFALGARHISVSTCGIVPGILRMIEEAPQVNLAISLHAPNQSLREELMPVAIPYNLGQLMYTLADYMRKTNRKVMFEYILLKGVNDSLKHAKQLAELLEPYKRLVHVNLIKYHDTGIYKPTEQIGRVEFQDYLKRRGISVTRRVSFGEDIQGACGQLATKRQNPDSQD
ncbi:23S rRNA (adenine(2503)-C(2))-methyltransferase RlmN [Candidatus Uhrbacteria bacterium]|nr:23S rRNA (adenine(2503)-C(2))-methyltransferase RlmN [Candidatus Uhrbacteria bacterium]